MVFMNKRKKNASLESVTLWLNPFSPLEIRNSIILYLANKVSLFSFSAVNDPILCILLLTN